MYMDYLKDWLRNKIEKYESVPDLFEDADSTPSVAYELGRYDSLIEIRDLLWK
jgi:hypothetical protein